MGKNKSLSKIEDNVDYSKANPGLPPSEQRDQETFGNRSGVPVQIFAAETYANDGPGIEVNANLS